MKKPISLFDLFRFMIAGAILSAGFIAAEHYLYEFFKPDKITTGFLLMRYFVVEGAACFVSLFIGLAFVGRRFKTVAGIIVMMSAMLVYIWLSVSMGIPNLITALADVVGLSFLAIGTCLAILAWENIASKMKKKQAVKAAPGLKNTPKLSRILLFLAALSVPATYIMMILSAFITIGVSAWLIGLLSMADRIPVFILVAAIFAPIISIWASFKAILAVFRPQAGETRAIIMDLDSKPGLKRTIQDVCRTVKTKMPDRVILDPEPNFFVTENPLKTVNGTTAGRTLSIGAPLLRAVSYNEFRAILGHEFAHFSGNDTLYSRFVLPVYTSVSTAMQEISAGGSGGNNSSSTFMQILLLVPITFLGLFMKYFATIDMILRRSRELRADWLSAVNFGPANMKNALLNIAGASALFYEEYRNVPASDVNYFEEYGKFMKAQEARVAGYTEEAMKQRSDDLDSHPALAERLEALPDGSSAGIYQSMDFILGEIKADEDKLSKTFRELLDGMNKEYGEQEVKVPEDMAVLLETQFMLLRKVFDFNTEAVTGEDEKALIMRHLITGEQIPEEALKKLPAACDALKKCEGICALFMKGAAIRISVLEKNHYEARAEKLKAAYDALKLDYSGPLASPLPEITAYAREAFEYKA